MIDVAWSAGILEGEGCFVCSKRPDRPNTPIRAIHLEMTDEDIVRRVAAIYNVGTVILRPNISGRKDKCIRKQSWIWSVQNKAGIKLVLESVLPFLGERRTEKAKELLATCE